MPTRGDQALRSNLLRQTRNRCAKCGNRIDIHTAHLVEVPASKYEPPSPVRILRHTEPRCTRCARYALR